MKNLFYATAAAVSLLSCVSVKKYDAQAQTLQSTQNKLEQTTKNQEKLALDFAQYKDSVQKAEQAKTTQHINQTYTLYKTAVSNKDYIGAAARLQDLIVLDSANMDWGYDSLALYHYMYLVNAATTQRTPAAMYYTQKGLELNPLNPYLLELKGKLLIEKGNDTGARRMFNELWNRVPDYTYLWEMTYIDLYVYGKIKETEKLISEVIARSDAGVKTVRIERIEDHIIETVPAATKQSCKSD
jgi:predicted Zn-dependent protease